MREHSDEFRDSIVHKAGEIVAIDKYSNRQALAVLGPGLDNPGNLKRRQTREEPERDGHRRFSRKTM